MCCYNVRGVGGCAVTERRVRRCVDIFLEIRGCAVTERRVREWCVVSGGVKECIIHLVKAVENRRGYGSTSGEQFVMLG